MGTHTRRLLLAGLMLVPLVALADENLPSGPPKDEPTRRITVTVGESMSIGYTPVQTICDDTSILRIEDSASGAKIVGVKPGKTLCGFTRGTLGAGSLAKELVEVTVEKK
jgi:hypothetical protein